MAWFSSKVEVTFIDDSTGEPFGATHMQPDDLPETFSEDTTVHLGDDEWSVVRAEPTTRAEIAKAKTLTLRLRRIEKIDANQILYSLPSICDFIPGLSDSPLSGREFVLSEDDWRQLEFVSHDLANTADAEIEQIRKIHETAFAEVGWREIHVRSRPESPVVGNLTLAELAALLNIPSASSGVTYHRAQLQISDGYSFNSDDGMTAYGVAPNGNVQVIALSPHSNSRPTPESINQLKTLARELNLDLVNWCRCIRVGPDDPEFESLIANDE